MRRRYRRQRAEQNVDTYPPPTGKPSLRAKWSLFWKSPSLWQKIKVGGTVVASVFCLMLAIAPDIAAIRRVNTAENLFESERWQRSLYLVNQHELAYDRYQVALSELEKDKEATLNAERYATSRPVSSISVTAAQPNHIQNGSGTEDNGSTNGDDGESENIPSPPNVVLPPFYEAMDAAAASAAATSHLLMATELDQARPGENTTAVVVAIAFVGLVWWLLMGEVASRFESRQNREATST